MNQGRYTRLEGTTPQNERLIGDGSRSKQFGIPIHHSDCLSLRRERSLLIIYFGCDANASSRSVSFLRSPTHCSMCVLSATLVVATRQVRNICPVALGRVSRRLIFYHHNSAVVAFDEVDEAWSVQLVYAGGEKAKKAAVRATDL